MYFNKEFVLCPIVPKSWNDLTTCIGYKIAIAEH